MQESLVHGGLLVILELKDKMNTKMTASEIESAFMTATNDLRKDDIAWIRESALAERAYILGVYNALGALGNTSQIDGKVIVALSRTLWHIDGDKES